MNEILFADSGLPLLSPRTAKYVEAIIREGDSFDYHKWLKRVREEEAEAKQAEATGTSGEFVPAAISNPISSSASDGHHGRQNPALLLIPKTVRVPRRLRPLCRAKSQTPKARLRRWLEKVHGAWVEFQASRRRDSVYEFLAAVFAIVMHYRVRRRTNRLLRHAFELANLRFDKNADPFAAIIRCTCGNAVDTKTISKWSRALRFVARSKNPDSELRTFMKKALVRLGMQNWAAVRLPNLVICPLMTQPGSRGLNL
jgi:hypothetical protein